MFIYCRSLSQSSALFLKVIATKRSGTAGTLPVNIRTAYRGAIVIVSNPADHFRPALTLFVFRQSWYVGQPNSWESSLPESRALEAALYVPLVDRGSTGVGVHTLTPASLSDISRFGGTSPTRQRGALPLRRPMKSDLVVPLAGASG